jgi:trk system potassium uptake protein TrkH
VGSFAALILVGTLVLYLPVMQGPRPVSFLDCLFTATSAVCVTGLITVDTPTAWSGWGQVVILCLFQLGGLGIMSFSVALLHLAGRQPGLTSRLALKGALGPVPADEMGRLTRNIILYTLLVEAAGAAVLTLRFWADYPLPRAAALGGFHAVSAFCNAGFSLFSNSLEDYTTDPVVNLTITALIITGGLGFLVLREVIRRLGQRLRGQRPHRLSLNARLVLLTSAWLLFGGAALLWVLEAVGGAGAHWGQGLWSAWFTAVTARTAGFDTVPMRELSNASLLVIMILMFVGASPGSTGGGVKTTALATLVALARNRLKGLPGASLCGRSVEERSVGQALTLVLVSAAVLLVGILLLVTFEVGETGGHQRGAVITHAFEAVSAFATVGLSVDVTPHLTPPGKLVVIALMFLGRLGPLTFIYALTERSRRPRVVPAEEPVMLG